MTVKVSPHRRCWLPGWLHRSSKYCSGDLPPAWLSWIAAFVAVTEKPFVAASLPLSHASRHCGVGRNLERSDAGFQVCYFIAMGCRAPGLAFLDCGLRCSDGETFRRSEPSVKPCLSSHPAIPSSFPRGGTYADPGGVRLPFDFPQGERTVGSVPEWAADGGRLPEEVLKLILGRAV